MASLQRCGFRLRLTAHSSCLLECGCDVRGSASSVCDVTTGQCLCRENVTGLTCERCQVRQTDTDTSGRGYHGDLIHRPLICSFLSRASSGSSVGGAVRPVAASSQGPSLSHVMKWDGACVWRVWLATSVTAVAMVTIVSMEISAQVVK